LRSRRNGSTGHASGEATLSSEKQMIRTSKTKQPTTILESLDDLPEFRSEAEEAEFWSTHELGQEILDAMGSLDDVLPPPDSRRLGRMR
jgi:hypothetical protein